MRVLCRYTLIMLFAGIYFGNSQVKIGDNLQLIDSSSLLELESSTRALVLTRVNENQMSAITPLNGALVYNTDAECIFMYSGDSWRNLCETNNINAIANNGLSLINGNSVQLGGQLIRPTTIQTDATNTLSLNGIQTTNDIDPMFLVLDSNNTITQITRSSLIQKDESVIIASDGQNQFTTPQTITNINNIDVYRNGVKINFSAVGPNLIELQSNIICFDNDEIRIVQIQ
ncbi:hypothetical protein LDL77_11365 [Flagellimonas marinaquae]|uniref:Organic solvent tolerance-like N-terminal domain-containing protein n=1 Tax=Flagellimonas aurea TaxID=2915619 RepID=A0ABS3G691_9FLAO|nr:hypothetical protein [Allomuricauda aurea]MBO0354929.1 hypothetical protein [Allomuricauda aurea]UBZ12492.1 hypothetical protein LDL77_11365 [Allomuricauda aquimarina]